MDELFETLMLIQIRTINPAPVILIGPHCRKHAGDFEYLLDESVIDSEDRDIFRFAETVQETWQGFPEWRDQSGEPLIAPGSRGHVKP